MHDWQCVHENESSDHKQRISRGLYEHNGCLFGMEGLVGFLSGFVYGITSVVVGQPFDTLKTLKQNDKSLNPQSYTQIAKDLIRTDGPKGLYRGSMAPLIGGAFFRSAQFGFYESTMSILKKNTTDHKYFGWLSWHVIVSGASGGLGRGFIEGFADHVKVRKMMNQPWSLRSLRKESGLGITLIRNVNLFGSFVIYMDLSKQLTNGQLGPFMTGGICASLAWFSVWPLDVVKSRVQSGDFHKDQNLVWQLKEVFRTGAVFRGLLPGLARAFLANGCSMIMYRKADALFRGILGPKRDQ